MSDVCKPSSVLDDHLSGPAVASRLKRLPGSATGRRRSEPRRIAAHASLSILHQVGFTARTSRQAAGELLPRLSILASSGEERACPKASPPFTRSISVALSLKSPSPAVNRHPALWCSDFPHATGACDRLASSQSFAIYEGVIPPCRRVCGRSCRTPRSCRRCECPAAWRWAAT